MLTRIWVDAIEAAVVVVGVATAWLTMRKARPAKPKADAPMATKLTPSANPSTVKVVFRGRSRQPWRVHENEAEIARRKASKESASKQNKNAS